MSDLLVGTRECLNDAGERLSMGYYLLCDCDGSAQDPYGVMIDSSDGGRCRIPHITPDQQRAQALLSLLIQNTATPVELPYLIDDWLAVL